MTWFKKLTRGLKENFKKFTVDEVAISSDPETTKIFRVIRSDSHPQWVFEVVAGLDSGRRYLITNEKTKIGRQPDNHIQLKDPQVSRFHAVVWRRGDQLFLNDLKSSNGTLLNDQKLNRRRKIVAGDMIQIGDTVIKVFLET